MFINDEEFDRRVNRDDNLITKLRKDKNHKGRGEIKDGQGRQKGDNNVPPIVREIVGTLAQFDSRSSIADAFNVSPAQVSNYKNGMVTPQLGDSHDENIRLQQAIDRNLSRVRDKALEKLVMTLDAITPEKVHTTVKAKDLSAVASNLSSIVQKSMPIAIQRRIHESSGSAQVQLNLYAPTTKDEQDYEVITINK